MDEGCLQCEVKDPTGQTDATINRDLIDKYLNQQPIQGVVLHVKWVCSILSFLMVDVIYVQTQSLQFMKLRFNSKVSVFVPVQSTRSLSLIITAHNVINVFPVDSPIPPTDVSFTAFISFFVFIFVLFSHFHFVEN
jgi:hypothetical protein